MSFFDEIKLKFGLFLEYIEELIKKNWLDIFKYVLTIVLNRQVIIENAKDNGEETVENLKQSAREYVVASARSTYPEAEESTIRIAVEMSVELIRTIGFINAQKFEDSMQAIGTPTGQDPWYKNPDFMALYTSQPDKK